MDYIKNAWFAAGWSSKIDDELRRGPMPEENIVMFRKSKSVVMGLEDRRPHRMLPVSKSKRIDDDIQCGYHGMTFNCEG